jgi:predicted metal-binding membrane protein
MQPELVRPLEEEKDRPPSGQVASPESRPRDVGLMAELVLGSTLIGSFLLYEGSSAHDTPYPQAHMHHAGHVAASCPHSCIAWVAMMVAMMLPLGAVSAAARGRKNHLGPGRIVIFIGGYLLVWALWSEIAWLADVVLGRFSENFVLAGDARGILDCAIMSLAGSYQLTGTKLRVLTGLECGLAHEAQRELPIRSEFFTGLKAGSYCLMSCWALMLLMLLDREMSLLSMALLSAYMLCERMLRHPRALSRATGLILISSGIVGMVRLWS